MCGIYGVLHFDDAKVANSASIQRASKSMNHRGPDGQGIFVEGKVGLAHRRLSIIDVETGGQPMHSADSRFVMVYNGEIYNFLELREQLARSGHLFVTQSDTEVVLKSFQVYGEKAFSMLRGMFAIAIWDRERRELTLARDRIGIKPLYLHATNDMLQFGSEVKALIASGLYEAQLNDCAVYPFLNIGYMPGPETFFKGVFKLSPGCYTVYQHDGKSQTSRYWSLPSATNQAELPSMSFSEKLAETVKQHMIADVPVGAFLSGGLDSSAIVALMSQLDSERINTFSVGYNNSGTDSELPHAAVVAKHFNTRHHEFILEPNDFLESIENFLEHCEEPIGESQSIPFYKLAQLAQPHVKVMLSGEGADEILGGYGIYEKMMVIDRWSRIARLPVVNQIIQGSSKLVGSQKLSKLIQWLTDEPSQRYRSVNATQVTAQVDALIASAKYSDAAYFREQVAQLHARASHGSLLRTMNGFDLLAWMPDNSLIRGDKMSMAASIEVRVPFLDHELVEYSLGLPDKLKIDHGVQKVVLRESMVGLLPESILKRRKQGFTVPLSRWFKGELNDQIRQILTDRQFLDRGIVTKSGVENYLEKMRQGHGYAVDMIFRLLVLELWIRKYCIRPSNEIALSAES
jgi:asparagine synthase (glutamine-hydrolysing)